MQTMGGSEFGILAVVATGALSFSAAAQNRAFSFAYDQPKNSGYGAGATFSTTN